MTPPPPNPSPADKPAPEQEAVTLDAMSQEEKDAWFGGPMPPMKTRQVSREYTAPVYQVWNSGTKKWEHAL